MIVNFGRNWASQINRGFAEQIGPLAQFVAPAQQMKYLPLSLPCRISYFTLVAYVNRWAESAEKFRVAGIIGLFRALPFVPIPLSWPVQLN
jgi:hypothetical protein